MSSSCDIEVLICTHNRRALLERTLRSLNSAKQPEGVSVRIVVVANGCIDSTHQLLEAYRRSTAEEGRLPLDWIAEAGLGKSRALNLVIPLLEGKAVAMVDDDHRVDSNYLLACSDALLRYPNAGLFCGRILPDWDGTEPSWVHDTEPYRIYPLPVPRFDQGDTPMVLKRGAATPGGGNLFIRRDVFKAVGGFLTDLGPVGHNLGGAEDIDWVNRAREAGFSVQYIPEVVQYHYVDVTRLRLWYLVRKAYERSSSMVEVAEGSLVLERFPYFSFRKIANYALMAATSLGQRRRRFYLVRLAASIGELKAYIKLRLRRRGGALPSANR